MRNTVPAIFCALAIASLTACPASRSTRPISPETAVTGDPAARQPDPISSPAEPGAIQEEPTTEGRRFPWMRPPAPIAGTWKVSAAPGCLSLRDMVIAISVSEDTPPTATGRVLDPGAGTKLGYGRGDVIMELKANDFGKWPGKVKWRSIRGDQRWDPAHFVLQEPTMLSGTMVVDGCWKSLIRVR